MVEPGPIVVHLRSASGPDLTRFALDFASNAGGDLLWIAYVPEGVRGWFGRFADSIDRSRAPGSQYRIARLFGSPSSEDLRFLLDRIECRRAPASDVVTSPRDPQSPEVARVADEIDRGWLHVTGLLLDIHHLPTFARTLRSASDQPATPTPLWRTRKGGGRSSSLNLNTILRRSRAAGLHVLFTSIESSVATPAGKSPARDDAASVLGAIDAAADLTLSLGRGAVGADNPQEFGLRVCHSRYPELPAGPGWQVADWNELLAAIRPRLGWSERLTRAYPRAEPTGPGELRESAAIWSDPVQDEFARVAERRGWTVTRASPEQDRGEHWDVRVVRGGESFRIDVKARSKVRRRDPLPQDTWHWVELRGIADAGWLFGGKADLIAFQSSNSFLLVRRVDLAAHVRHHVDPEVAVADPRRAEYRVYHRRDLGDPAHARATGSDRGVLMLIPTGRLRLLAWEEWAADSERAP